jgi:hypothetical protein
MGNLVSSGFCSEKYIFECSMVVFQNYTLKNVRFKFEKGYSKKSKFYRGRALVIMFIVLSGRHI